MASEPFRIARYLGVLLLICALILLLVNPKPANNLPKDFYTPIIAFEFIQTPQEVAAFFDIPDVNSYIRTMLLGNWIDYGFMVLYSALLFFIALGIKRISGAQTMLLAFVCCITMLVFDALENYQIHLIITHYKNQAISGNLALLNIFTWLKWSSIASAFLVFSPFFLKGKWFHKIIGCLCISCFVLGIAAFVRHGLLNELFAGNVVLVFLLLVIFAFTNQERISTTL
ncbi:MAG: hypothetical protein IPM95_07925 [Sphingobacteriales bacterium]|jgi:hypothetical protein|nr:hypothetical protein [Sphingobacteriales bacterium]